MDENKRVSVGNVVHLWKKMMSYIDEIFDKKIDKYMKENPQAQGGLLLTDTKNVGGIIVINTQITKQAPINYVGDYYDANAEEQQQQNAGVTMGPSV